MEVFRTNEYYILLNIKSSLWCCRKTGQIQVKPCWELAYSGDLQCLGTFHGLVGKVDFQIAGEARLMLIKETERVGDLPDGREVVKIRSIAFLPVVGPDVTPAELGLKACTKHQGKASGPLSFDKALPHKQTLTKTWNSLKSATSSIKPSNAYSTNQAKGPQKKDAKEREKFEKRILDELHKIFTETQSFYFCTAPPGSNDSDLTNSLQRSCSNKTTDDRFFWNKYMLKDVLQINNDLAAAWVLPIIQGYVQIEKFKMEVDPSSFGAKQPTKIEREITLGIISRRSRYRAGTRYKRRGLDEDGKCANYVETEQFVATSNHHISFAMVRGSVPVFWSQPGYKYRPPPLIDKSEAETKVAFRKHMQEELSIYGKVCIVNLVEQTGKEKVVCDAFTSQVLQLDSDRVTYATFDFHEHCRGLRFENVSYLVSRLEEVMQEMGFCWRDSQGVICEQTSVFRVNCIDCLDRTNVVQTALGKSVLEVQLTKLGLLPPEGIFPDKLRNTFHSLWANNGDIISKQYAGTNALKGDFTRTGERKFTGMMKDGMNSASRYLRRIYKDEVRQLAIDICVGPRPPGVPPASFLLLHRLVETLAAPSYSSPTHFENELLLGLAAFNLSRYYLSKFKDVYRQATINIMQGQIVSEEMLTESEDADSSATAEHVKLLIEDCKKLIISDSSLVVGAWGLINADPVTGDPNETDMDTILILTRSSYCVADYDDEIDQVTKCQHVQLSDLTMVELGPADFNPSQNPLQIFNKPKNKLGQQYCLRFRYRSDGNLYAHTFRSSNLRFFNNMAIFIKSDEEMIESLRAICDCVRVALEVANEDSVQWSIGHPLTKLNLNSSPGSSTLRNISESQLSGIRSVGTKALLNMTSTFNRFGSTIRRKSSTPQSDTPIPDFTVREAPESGEEGGVNLGDSVPSHGSQDTFLPNVGIVMSNTTISNDSDDIIDSDDVLITTDDEPRPSSLSVNKPSELRLRTFSHSSGEVDDKDYLQPNNSGANSGSDSKLQLNLGSITSSQSENALRSIKSSFSTATNVLTSPSAVAVLSPLTKLAKGMQSLGANLDPRRLKPARPSGYSPTSETNKLKELWSSSPRKTKLIAV